VLAVVVVLDVLVVALHVVVHVEEVAHLVMVVDASKNRR